MADVAVWSDNHCGQTKAFVSCGSSYMIYTVCMGSGYWSEVSLYIKRLGLNNCLNTSWLELQQVVHNSHTIFLYFVNIAIVYNMVADGSSIATSYTNQARYWIKPKTKKTSTYILLFNNNWIEKLSSQFLSNIIT